jgi:hypothetical protein
MPSFAISFHIYCSVLCLYIVLVEPDKAVSPNLIQQNGVGNGTLIFCEYFRNNTWHSVTMKFHKARRLIW